MAINNMSVVVRTCLNWMKRHFKAFKDNGCEGSAFNSYRFTPSSQLRRRLS